MSQSYRNKFNDLQRKSVNWFLYDSILCHERVKYIKMITWFLFPYILTQGKFRKSCLWKINLFCYIGRKSLREGIIAKNCKDLWGFFLEYWYKWIPLSFALDIILLKKFHLMSLEDVIRINVFRKSVVAIRDWYKNISNF